MAKKSSSGPRLVQRRSSVEDVEAALIRAAVPFRQELMDWYHDHARELPWRGVSDPYATWLSEIMLQQTRVATVIDRYQEFLRRFPTITALAVAEESSVLALWSGLGYYRRARMLHRGAQFVVRELDGALPHTAVALRTLPGIGEYTSAAIASIAFGESVAVVDGNVERVLLRLLGLPEERTAMARARINRVAQSLIPAARSRRDRTNPPGDHNQAMMELGATICTPRAPLCLQCPVVKFCLTRGEHPTMPRGRQTSRIAAYLLAVRKAGTITEVLLERRATNASIMAGMYELPPLPLTAVEGHEPVLRIRHAITNTNYYAQIYSSGAPATSSSEVATETSEPESATPDRSDEAYAVTTAEQEIPPLLAEIPAAADTLFWTPTHLLHTIPLTGLARKAMQRLHVMDVPPVKIG